MPEPIRFHPDEHLDSAIAEGLRRHGVNVTTTVDAGLRTRPDEEQLAFAVRERRVLVTGDTDFLQPSIGRDHPGIVFVPMGKRTIGEIIRALLLVHGALTADEMRGAIERV